MMHWRQGSGHRITSHARKAWKRGSARFRVSRAQAAIRVHGRQGGQAQPTAYTTGDPGQARKRAGCVPHNEAAARQHLADAEKVFPGIGSHTHTPYAGLPLPLPTFPCAVQRPPYPPMMQSEMAAMAMALGTPNLYGRPCPALRAFPARSLRPHCTRGKCVPGMRVRARCGPPAVTAPAAAALPPVSLLSPRASSSVWAEAAAVAPGPKPAVRPALPSAAPAPCLPAPFARRRRHQPPQRVQYSTAATTWLTRS